MGNSRANKENIMLYVEPGLKSALKVHAKADGRSMTNFIVRLLSVYCEEHPLPDDSSVSAGCVDSGFNMECKDSPSS